MKWPWAIFLLCWALNLPAQTALPLEQLVADSAKACLVADCRLIPLRPLTPQSVGQPVYQLAQPGNKALKLMEMSRSVRSSTPELVQVRNTSRQAYWLAAGTLLKGGWQNRALAEAALIPPGDSPVYLPTLCVEKNRWQGRSARLSIAGLPPALLLRQLNRNPHQQAVWRLVDQLLDSLGRSNPTADLLRLPGLDQPVVDARLQDCANTWLATGATGVMVMKNGQPAFAEVLAQPAMLLQLLPTRWALYNSLPTPSSGGATAGRQGLGTAHARYWF